jgi:RNA polymerase sigma factor (TIGR02999 family)
MYLILGLLRYNGRPDCTLRVGTIDRGVSGQSAPNWLGLVLWCARQGRIPICVWPPLRLDSRVMADVTRILSAIQAGDSLAAEQLLPLVYDELKKLAAARMAAEVPGQTLQATALVHEAYLRLVNVDQAQHWNSRGHFFAAAAEAMRRILVDQARRKLADKYGGGQPRVELPDELSAPEGRSDDLLALDEALGRLECHDADAARLVKLRYFAGLTHQGAADALGISRGAADRLWALGRAWLFRQLSK